MQIQQHFNRLVRTKLSAGQICREIGIKADDFSLYFENYIKAEEEADFQLRALMASNKEKLNEIWTQINGIAVILQYSEKLTPRSKEKYEKSLRKLSEIYATALLYDEPHKWRNEINNTTCSLPAEDGDVTIGTETARLREHNLRSGELSQSA